MRPNGRASAPLTAVSLEHNSVPVAVPDFTRGDWNKTDGYRHAMLVQ